MSDTLIVLHTAIAIIVIVLLIVVAKVDPVISLVIGTLYLGVAAGLGYADTIGTLVRGFGDIMAEVGLLIGFGVLMGSLLTAMGALQKLVELLLRIFGRRLRHTGPDIGWHRSPHGGARPGHRLRCAVRLTSEQQLLLDVHDAAGAHYPRNPQVAYPRNLDGVSSLLALDLGAQSRNLTAELEKEAEPTTPLGAVCHRQARVVSEPL